MATEKDRQIAEWSRADAEENSLARLLRRIAYNIISNGGGCLGPCRPLWHEDPDRERWAHMAYAARHAGAAAGECDRDIYTVSSFVTSWWPGLEDGLSWPDDADEPEGNTVYAAALRLNARYRPARTTAKQQGGDSND